MPKLDLSWYDRAIVSVFPKYGSSRIRARVSLDLVKRHYEAAEPGRRTQNWRRDATDADFALRGASAQLRWSARDLIRNNGWARRARQIVANSSVGYGIRPKAIADDEAQAQQATKLWKKWAATTECESDNRQTFYGIQHLAMKNLFSDGEVLIRRRYRRATDDLTIPLQLQVIEADYLQTGKNALVSDAGGPIIQGIEFDKLGARAAYWLWKNHPGSGRNMEAPVRVPAEEVIHLYDVERAGQSRGVSWLAFGLLNMKDLDDYEDAELMKQKIAACFAAFTTDTNGFGAPVVGDEDDPTNDDLEVLEPGMIANLPPGRDVKFGNPPTMTADALPVRTLRKFAAGVGITYEDLTGDYSMVNFSSARMARIGFQGNVTYWQESIVIPILCQTVWKWAMEAAIIAGELPADAEVTADWTAPALPMLEPDKEAQANQRRVRAGLATLSQVIREGGNDPDEFLEEYAADMKKLDELEIVLDSDARKTTAQGQEQASETAQNSPPEPKALSVPMKK